MIHQIALTNVMASINNVKNKDNIHVDDCYKQERITLIKILKYTQKFNNGMIVSPSSDIWVLIK